jgi:acyl-CoA synthetase (AMP-forming)/AMP-acid ligase II
MDGGREVKHGDVGEICVRGDNVMLGYYNDPGATRDTIDPEGWLHTEDLGRLQRGGYIEIVDRAKDLIIVKGLNVYSREVEDVLLSHSSVAEAAVVGVPDEDGDETVKAFVVPKEGRKVEKSELLRLCKEQLAPYKWPKEVILASFLPKNSIGKVIKRELKEDVGVSMQ